MNAEQECQRKQSQQTQPKPGETSGEGSSTSVLKVKSQKGKTVKVIYVKEGKLIEEEVEESRKEDESEKNDKPIEQEGTGDESDTLPVEFEDKMYELMQEMEMAMEYQEMTTKQENELVSQLIPREKAKYQEMREYYQLQAKEMEQGVELRSAEIKEKARRRAPGLLIDLIQ